MTILDVLICRGTEPSKEEIKEALDFIKSEIKTMKGTKKIYNENNVEIGKIHINKNGKITKIIKN